MPTEGFDSMPTSGYPFAAYKPIYFVLQASLVGGAAPPVAYLDIYFNGIFYKTLSKTQPVEVGTVAFFEFDIQDAAQEYLSKFIAPNGGTGIVTAVPLTVQCFCRGRASTIDSEGYILPDPTEPVQATGDAAAVPGSGDQSDTFTIVNMTIQHEESYDVPNTLNAFQRRDGWGVTTYPLSNRPDHYKVCVGDSDYFPILSTLVPDQIRLIYRPKDSPDFVDETGDTTCAPVGGLPATLPNALVGSPYSVIIPLTGNPPFSLDASTGPAWLSIDIDGDNNLVLTGTPTPGDAGSAIEIDVTISNCGGVSTASIATTINVLACSAVNIPDGFALPDARSGIPYFVSIPLAGAAPFVIDGSSLPAWLTATIVGSTLQLTGTPADGDVDTGITVSVDVCNCSGYACDAVEDLIDVLASNNFELSASFNFRIDGVTGDGAPVDNGPTTTNGRKFTHHSGMDGGSYFVTVTGTIVTTTSIAVTVDGVRHDCILIGTVVGTVISGVTYELDISGVVTEAQNVRFSIFAGNC